MRVEVPGVDLGLDRFGDMVDNPRLLYFRLPDNSAVAGLDLETFDLWMVGFAAGPLSLGLGEVQVLLRAPICSAGGQNVQDTVEEGKVVRRIAGMEVCWFADLDGSDAALLAVLERKVDDLK